MVVKKPGFYITIPLLGSFRSPFRVRVPDKLMDIVRVIFFQNGIKDFEVLEKEEKEPEKVEVVKKVSKSSESNESKGVTLSEEKISELLKKIDNMYSLLEKISLKDFVKEVVVEKEGVKIVKEDEEVFIPTIPQVSSVDLNVKTTTKEDITSVVESLMKVKEEKKF